MGNATPHEPVGAAPERPTTLLVIAGMHRSGTSALARSCNLLGVDLGSDFIPTRSDNASGFWEDAGVKDTDDLALASYGMLWDDVRALPEPWRDGFGADEIRARLHATLGTLVRRGPWCGVKDPRISRLLPLWLPLLERLDATPVFLIALRDPLEVARSLERREGLSTARSLLLWLRYNMEAERHTRGRRRAFVCFADLLRDWRAALDRAAREAGIAWPVSFADAADAIGTFLDPGLRHHVAPEPPSDAAAGLVRFAGDAFAALRGLRGADTATGWAELDRLHALLAGADLALGPMIAELEEQLASRRAPDAEAGEADAGTRTAPARELDRARREALLAHELVAQRDREIVEATEAAARFAAERDVLARRIAAADAALAARAAEVAALQNDAASLRNDVAVWRAEAEVLRADKDAALRAIAGVERSLSWRLTSPLRALGAIRRSRPGDG